MASRPQMIPEDQPWLILEHGIKFEVVEHFPSKRECLEYILECRMQGDATVYLIYGPDSKHGFALANLIEWEKSNA